MTQPRDRYLDELPEKSRIDPNDRLILSDQSETEQAGRTKQIRASLIGGLNAEQVRDLVASFIRGGTGIDVAHDDESDSLIISVSTSHQQLTPEQVQDIVANFIQAGANVTVTYDDAGEHVDHRVNRRRWRRGRYVCSTG